MAFILWLIAVALVLYGLYLIFAVKRVALGIVVVIVGLLIGPGGVSIFTGDDDIESLGRTSSAVEMGRSVPFAA